MKAGVSTLPCFSDSVPRRAGPSLQCNLNFMSDQQLKVATYKVMTMGDRQPDTYLRKTPGFLIDIRMFSHNGVLSFRALTRNPAKNEISSFRALTRNPV